MDARQRRTQRTKRHLDRPTKEEFEQATDGKRPSGKWNDRTDAYAVYCSAVVRGHPKTKRIQWKSVADGQATYMVLDGCEDEEGNVEVIVPISTRCVQLTPRKLREISREAARAVAPKSASVMLAFVDGDGSVTYAAYFEGAVPPFLNQGTTMDAEEDKPR